MSTKTVTLDNATTAYQELACLLDVLHSATLSDRKPNLGSIQTVAELAEVRASRIGNFLGELRG